MKFITGLCLCAVALLITACAASVSSTSTVLTALPNASGSSGITVLRATEVRFPSGYTRVLPAGSRWSLAGQLPQGLVYRPANGVFTIEGRQIHEAWLVVDKTRLAGFYLVGESAYSPLDLTITLPLETTP